jgi:hypothetical protein
VPDRHAFTHTNTGAQTKAYPAHRQQSRGDSPKAGLPDKNTQKKTQPQQKSGKSTRYDGKITEENQKVKKNPEKTGNTRAKPGLKRNFLLHLPENN